jgi:hypothetical protein
MLLTSFEVCDLKGLQLCGEGEEEAKMNIGIVCLQHLKVRQQSSC